MAKRGVGVALKRAMRWPVWAIEALPFFLVMGIFKIVGLDAASSFGGWLARTLGPLSPANRTAERNLTRAMPELDEAQRRAIITGMWDNLGRTFAEYPHLKRFARLPNPRIEVAGLENAKAALAKGKGTILVSGHFANWEVMAMTAYHSGLDGAELYRPVNNRIVNAWIVRQRKAYAYPLQVSKTGESARALLTTLKSNRSIAMLSDQKHREGEAIPFFGRDAMTVPGPGVLSLRTGAAIVPVTMVRTGGARFRMQFWPELQIAKSGDKTADIRAVLVAINLWLEQAVRAAPSMWLWAHDRWMDGG